MEQRCKRKFKRFKKLGEIKLRVWKEFIGEKGNACTIFGSIGIGFLVGIVYL